MRFHRHRIAMAALLAFATYGMAQSTESRKVLAANRIRIVKSGQDTGSCVGESFENLASRAQAAMEADRIPEAIRLYRRATELRPDWPEGWWHLGTLYFDGQRFDEARDAFATFVARERKQPGPGFAMLGLSEFQLGHYPKALASLETALKLGVGTDPAFVREVLIHDGILNSQLGKPEIALQRLTLAANQIAAENPEAPRDAVFADLNLLDAFGIAALRIPKVTSDLISVRNKSRSFVLRDAHKP